MNRTLSPKQLARAIDVSESSLKRWADSGAIRATRTAGGHRRISLPEAIRFIRESDVRLVHPEALGLKDIDAVQDRSDADARIRESLEQGETEAVRGAVLWRYLRGDSVASLCDGPLRSAMESLGEAWKTRRDGIFLEHRATDICLQALDQLRVLTEIPADAPVVVGGAPSGDPYVLPSVMAAAALGADGWRAVNLGPETPADSFVSAVEHYGASLVWLSLTSNAPTRARMEGFVGQLLDSLDPSVSLVVGGRMRQKIADVESPRLRTGDTLAELVAFARDRTARS